MSLNFAVEKWDDIAHELPNLFLAHYKEIAEDQDRIPLAPDAPRYAALDIALKLLIVTARSRDTLVGYSFGFIDSHMHYVTTIFGAGDMYFLTPEHRCGWNGIRLMRVMEQEMKRRGVQKAVNHMKINHPHGQIYSYLGWKPSEIIYTKWIGD